MELNTILELVKAGFTKDEIMQMAQPQPTEPNTEPVQLSMDLPTQATEPAPAQVVEPTAQPKAEPAQQPAQAPAQQPKEPTMAEVMQSIAKLTSAVQANAIAQSVIPHGLQNQPTAEDMLAEIIRPTFKAREDGL